MNILPLTVIIGGLKILLDISWLNARSITYGNIRLLSFTLGEFMSLSYRSNIGFG